VKKFCAKCGRDFGLPTDRRILRFGRVYHAPCSLLIFDTQDDAFDAALAQMRGERRASRRYLFAIPGGGFMVHHVARPTLRWMHLPAPKLVEVVSNDSSPTGYIPGRDGEVRRA
jgi:hypothetical protein